MVARLFCKTGKLAGTDYEILDSATIGRDPNNQIVVSVDSVSKEQARILFDAQQGCYFLENLGVEPGTRLDGIVVRKRAKLNDLHVITLGGELDFIFVRGAKQSPPSPEEAGRQPLGWETLSAKPESISTPAFLRGAQQTPASPQKTPTGTLFAKLKKITLPAFANRSQPAAGKEPEEPPGLGTISAPREKLALPSSLGGSAQTPQEVDPAPTEQRELVLELELPEAESTLTYALTDGKHTLGRSAACEVRVEDSSVSRKHALLVVQSGVLTVKDLGSANKSYVNDSRVTSEVEVQSGSAVRFGKIEGRIVTAT